MKTFDLQRSRKTWCHDAVYIVSHGSCTTKSLRCFRTVRIYIRLLQRSIVRQDIKVDEEFEECIACGSAFAVSEMPRHQETCEVRKHICFNFV